MVGAKLDEQAPMLGPFRWIREPLLNGEDSAQMTSLLGLFSTKEKKSEIKAAGMNLLIQGG
jgi:hypothetical protein